MGRQYVCDAGGGIPAMSDAHKLHTPGGVDSYTFGYITCVCTFLPRLASLLRLLLGPSALS